jgi:hypothetical protein
MLGELPLTRSPQIIANDAPRVGGADLNTAKGEVNDSLQRTWIIEHQGNV